MSTQGYEYQNVRKKLMGQMKRCRDPQVRVKVELLLYGLKLRNVRLACKRLGFGKTFYYTWWKRLVGARFNIKALRERSRRPRRSPNQISFKLEQRIKYYRSKGFGPEMIQQYILREGGKKVSLSVIHHVICRRRAPIKRRAYKLKKHRKRYELPVPGQRLQVDVKFSPMLVGGETVYIYVAIDECTRWRFAKGYRALNEHWTREFLCEMKRAFPFPIHTIQTDNGHEFTFRLLNGREDHMMDVWCRENHIIHQLIPPGIKELNGKVERSHRIDADYFYGRAPTVSIEGFNGALEHWIKRYNHERPHKGIGYMTPLEKLKERIISLREERLTAEAEACRARFCKSVSLVEDKENGKKVAA